MDTFRVFVYMLMRDASLKQRIPCIIRISIFGAFSAGKKCALYKGKYGILKSWRGSTQKQYQVYVQKWYCFFSKRGFDPCSVPPIKALDFSAELFEQGLGYSTLNTVRSALSQVLPPEAGVSFGDLPPVRQ